MSLIPRDFINELLTRCDLVELIDARVSLRKRGSNYIACCPFHNEKSPSFTVTSAKQFYHCFGCGANGNAISFLMEYDRLNFVEAIEHLAAQLGLEIPKEAGIANRPQHSPDLYQLMDQAAIFYQRELRKQPQAIDYLKSRGLTGEIAREFRIGFASDSWDNLLKYLGKSREIIEQLFTIGLLIKKTENNYYDRFRNRIMFPIRDRRGRIIGFGGRVMGKDEPKYLNSPETPIFHKGSELYGLYEATQASRYLSQILVVEGYIDVIALAQHGIRNAVATLGTATTADHIQRLFRVAPEIIFCFDGDRAGQAAAWRALEIVLPYLQDGLQARFLFLPQGEDPDTLVRKEGEDNFRLRLTNADSLSEFLFAELSKQVNLADPEGRARFAKLAMPLLNQIPVGILQHSLFEQLANKVRMDINTLKKITQSMNKSSETMAAVSQNTPRRSPMRLAVALLLQNPHLITRVPNGLLQEELILDGGEIFLDICHLLQENLNLNTAAILEYWRDTPGHASLMKLAGWEVSVPPEGVEKEFAGVLERLQQLNHEKQVELLLEKANKNQLTAEEKILLQKLIVSSKS